MKTRASVHTSGNKWKHVVSMTIAGITLVLGTGLMADDTEIFLGNANSPTGVQPNVLFVLDNSGSMSGSSYDADGRPSSQSRIDILKQSFEDIMTNADGINVGLMIFNGSGGSILYPVTDIDRSLSSEPNMVSNIGMTSGADDAIELKSSGNVYVDDEILTVAHTPNREAGNRITAFLASENDDGEQSSSSPYSMYVAGHAQFNMYSPQTNGLRYSNLGIPPGATIVDARVEFTASRSDSSHVQIRISGENTKNPPQFTENNRDIQNRLNDPTTAFVDWELTGFDPWVYGEEYQSPNIAPIIQELVNRPDWHADDALVLLFEHVTGSGQRAGFLRREDRPNTHGLDGLGTLLHVEYNTANPATTDQIIGLRFDNIEIPAGATVTSARIDFVSAAANPAPDGLTIQVKVENSGDAQAFTASPNQLSNRTKFSDVALWSPDEEWNFNEIVTGPNVTNLVQRVVNDANGWCGGNAMAFYLEPATATDLTNRLAYAFEAGVGKKPTLTVSYEGGEGGCIQRTWSARISARENDAYQSTQIARANNTTNDLPLVDDTYVGLRFETVPVIAGSQVLEAYLELTAAANNSGAATFTIYGQDDSNPPAFPQDRRNISNRGTTSASVSWPLEDWEQDEIYRSPDISSIVNEVLANNDWNVGDAMAFILRTNSGNVRRFWSFDGASGKAPRLVMKVESGGIEANTNTVRWHEIELVNDLDPRGMTPVAGSMYEAAMYFTGGPVTYGQDRDGDRYGRVSHPDSYVGGTLNRDSRCTDDDLDSTDCRYESITGNPRYISPITSSCQTSHVVFLTDGVANQNQATSQIAALTGESNCSNDATNGGEKCIRTLTRWMANSDLVPSLSGSVNSVKTHTVAFNLSNPTGLDLMSDMAAEGGGGFYEANSAQELITAFDTILQSVRSTAATFVAPGATVNQFNRLSHRSEVYFSVFKPSIQPRWNGNLKRYKLLGNPAVISDVNDKAAVDPLTGYFKETAHSVWSPAIDGSIVAQGGAASQRPTSAGDLNVYTYLASAATSSTDLTAPVNTVHESNGNIDESMLGVASGAKRTEVLRWSRGVDVNDWDSDSDTTEARQQYEDPLHSVPQIITYGGTDAYPDTTIFFGTNGGYLHAIDGNTGTEVFSFLPESQLGLMETRFDNNSSYTHPYGVDGSPAAWVYDANGDNQLTSSDGDHAYLYFGLRRGGDEYFALDVTNRNKPRLMWHIQGGSGDFTELGQTWSTPVVAKIAQADEVIDVLVFGGGYDGAYDNITHTAPATVGNAIFVVNARTGERLWYASSSATSGNGQRLSDLQYPIPADVTVVDINGDGLADQFYAADLGGQILRFDVNPLATDATWIHGGVIAQLGDTSTPNNRRFFNAPDISLVNIAKSQKIAVAIGSGSRPNPLSRTTRDRFYVILQDSIFQAPETYTPITQVDLVDQSSSLTALTRADRGWYFDLPNSGEKVLSPSVTVANKVIFTTYSPDALASSCNPVIGTGRAYVVNLVDGSAAVDLDENNVLDDILDRSKTLASGNIPPSPKVLFPDDGAPTVLVGPEQPLQNIDLGLVDDWTQIYRRPEDPE